MTQNDTITIELIPPNLRREEMMCRIAETLNQLETLANHVYQEIDSKVSTFRCRLKEIDDRTLVVKNKISLMKSSGNKAIRVFANYKFPNDEIGINEYAPITRYVCDKKSRDKCPKYKSRHVPFDDMLLKEKTQFYSIPKVKHKNQWDFDRDGPLGRVPWERITSVSSLIVFNTGDNAYMRRSRGSSIYDQKIRPKKQAQDDAESGDIFAPPLSLLNAEQTEERETLHYHPEVRAPPQIMDQLPLALPSLPGIADDLAFNIADEEFLSASIPYLNMNGVIVPQLPEIIEVQNHTQTQISVSNIEAPHIVVPAPPLLPPPPPPLLPPPPPPPPPPVLEEIHAVKSSKIDNSQQLNESMPMPSVDGNRASLLESIRAAAGKPKKSHNIIAERKIEAKKNKQKEVVSGDLMSDLSKKLIMRRKGISGSNATTNVIDAQSSAMEKISAMIPPPAPQPMTEDDSNSDWD